ncbi:MAG: ATP-binding protein, partial [Candidatus Sulfotelmatobacter sp.]
MLDLVQRALAAKRESKYIEFKENFDPSSPADWCEIVKDIVAIANSGGGILIFGLDSAGRPTGSSLSALANLDSADVGNKVSKYTGPVQLEFESRELEKEGSTLHAFIVQAVSVPIVFQKPGTYDIGSGKQKTAFSVGTVYFRHGAKSEPGNSDDIRNVIERQLEFIRKSWIKGVRKVVEAPEGSQIITVRPTGGTGPSSFSPTLRGVKDPKATPVLLTRDRQKAAGVFVHEEVSEGIFDEINNVIDANRALARGQHHFFLGAPIYYRVYAERQHVVQREDDIALLHRSAVLDLYAPALFWTLSLPEAAVAETFAELYLHPRSPG